MIVGCYAPLFRFGVIATLCEQRRLHVSCVPLRGITAFASTSNRIDAKTAHEILPLCQPPTSITNRQSTITKHLSFSGFFLAHHASKPRLPSGAQTFSICDGSTPAGCSRPIRQALTTGLPFTIWIFLPIDNRQGAQPAWTFLDSPAITNCYLSPFISQFHFSSFRRKFQ